MMRTFGSLTAALLLLVAAPALAQTRPTEAPTAPIEKGSSVQIEYTLKDDAGAVLDSNKGGSPLRYTHGTDQMIRGLERQLLGMRAGDEKKVVVPPEDGYGLRNPGAQTEVAKELLPPGSLVVGTRLMARSPSGERRPVMVKEVKETTVVLDLNHPLAGKTLHFDVRVIGVEPPKGPASKDTPAADPTSPGPKPDK